MRIVVASVEPFALWAHADARGAAGAGTEPPLACSEDDRTVAHANGPARAAGVTGGMTLAGARQRLPDLTVLPAVGPSVDAAWEAFLDAMHDVSPHVRGLRTGVAAFAGDGHDAAAFAERTGARVGGAGTVEEAHLLAYTAEPGRAVVAAPEEDPWTRLDAAPVYLLGGVGLVPDDRRRLAWLGVDTVGRLRGWTPAQLTAFLGESGVLLRPYLHGPRTGRLPLRLPPPVIAAEHAFEDPASEPHEVDPVLERLLDRAVRSLGDLGTARVRIVARAEGIASDAARRAKAPLRDGRKLLHLARLALLDTHLVPFGLEGLRIELSGLVREAHPGELWPRRRRRREAAQAVHERFPGQARRFVLRDPDALRPELRWRLLDATSDHELRRPDEGAAAPAGAPDDAVSDAASTRRRARRTPHEDHARLPA